jgi:glycosyltransferase involved in cell wall biosynthesis
MLNEEKKLATFAEAVKSANCAVEAQESVSRLGKRCAFIIAHLGQGGAQRVAVNAANALVQRGVDVHIIVTHSRPTAYQLDSRVALHTEMVVENGRETLLQELSLLFSSFTKCGSPGRFVLFGKNLKRRFSDYLKSALPNRVLLLRRELRAIDADTVVSFLTQTNIITILATRGLKARTVISERNDPRLQRHRRRVELLRRLVYRRADLVTANSRGALKALEEFVPEHKLAFLPNPLPLRFSSEVAELAAPTVITVGRLVEQKGLDILLSAWARSVEHLPQWRLAIVGDGPLRGELQSLARNLRIESNVDWFGHVSDPFPLLRAAKIFVLTSLFEGTPNALLEAMMCGLPAVISDASPGPCELIGPHEDAGLQVPVGDVTATAEAIIRLALDEPLRQRLASAARERARPHHNDEVLGVWLERLGFE